MFSDVPVLGALLRALQSRKVVISLVAIIFSYLVTLVPELEAVREQLTAGLFFVITVVVTALSGTIAWEDVARMDKEAREHAQEPAIDPDQAKRDLADEIRDLLFPIVVDAVTTKLSAQTGPVIESVVKTEVHRQLESRSL